MTAEVRRRFVSAANALLEPAQRLNAAAIEVDIFEH